MLEPSVAVLTEAWVGTAEWGTSVSSRSKGFSYLPESPEVEEGPSAGGRDLALWMKVGERVSPGSCCFVSAFGILR